MAIESIDDEWGIPGLQARFDLRREEAKRYAAERNVSVGRARRILLVRDSIDRFKWRLSEELGFDDPTQAEELVARIKSAERHMSLQDLFDEFGFKNARLASPFWMLSMAEQRFDEGDFLTALETVANAATSIFGALDMAAWAAKSDAAAVTAGARWARLDSVKQWAFEQRRNDMQVSRAAVIRGIAVEVRAKAKDAGEPLSGDDQAVIATITSWFRKAKIS